MALHTIDMKTTSAGDVLPLRPSPGGIGPVSDNSGAVVPYIVGQQSNGFGTGVDYGIKVAQQGVDARTATADQLVMSSQFNMFKIAAVVTLTVTVAAAGVGFYYYSSAVDTSYWGSNVAGYQAFVKVPGGTQYQACPYVELGVAAAPLYGVGSFGSVVSNVGQVYAQVRVSDTTNNGDWRFKVYLFQETVS